MCMAVQCVSLYQPRGTYPSRAIVFLDLVRVFFNLLWGPQSLFTLHKSFLFTCTPPLLTPYKYGGVGVGDIR